MSSETQTDSFRWPKEEAERVNLFLSQDGADPVKCVIRFDENRKVFLVVLDNHTDDGVVDIIDPCDTVGANVEIKLLAFASSNPGERQVPSQNKISPADNEPKSNILADTQATAVLSIYVYPKISKYAKNSMLRFCSADRSNPRQTKSGIAFQEETDLNEKYVGHRFACHRHFRVAPAEDLTNLSILVNGIRHLSRPDSIVSPEEEERILVIVNPFSGKKRGVHEYDTIVLPILDQAGISHDCLVTTHEKHAEERMKKQSSDSDFRDISEYSGIVLIGGDGIIHEVLQGIHNRDDTESIFQKVKLGTIGAGTSNGFSASLAFASKENFAPLDSAFMIAKGKTSWVDLSRYETKSKSYSSFLTFSWAMIADIDIESECIRWAGFLRMDIWGVVRVLFLRKYRAKFSYRLPKKTKTNVTIPPLSEPLPTSDDWVTCEDEFILFWASLVTHAGEQMFHAPPCKLDDGVFHIMIVRGNISRLRLAYILLSMEHGGHYGMKGVEFIQCSAYRLEPITSGSFNDLDGEVIESGPIQAAVMPSSIQAYCNPR